jgi:hypothetical protein
MTRPVLVEGGDAGGEPLDRVAEASGLVLVGVPREVIEVALAHAIENKVEAAYRCGDLFDRRRALMDEWAKLCARGKAMGGSLVVLMQRS